MKRLKTEKYQEEQGGGKQVHPDRVQVGHAFPFGILPGHKTRTKEEIFHGMEKSSVEMEYIVNKMTGKGPETFTCFYVFLAAVMAIPADNDRITVQAVLFFAFTLVGHVIFS